MNPYIERGPDWKYDDRKKPRPGWQPNEETGFDKGDPKKFFDQFPWDGLEITRQERLKSESDPKQFPVPLQHPIDSHRKGVGFQKLSDKELWQWGSVQDHHVKPNPEWDSDHYRPMMPTSFARNAAEKGASDGFIKTRGMLPMIYGRKQVFYRPSMMDQERQRHVISHVDEMIKSLLRIAVLGVTVGFFRGIYSATRQIRSTPGWEVRINTDSRLRKDIFRKKVFIMMRRTATKWLQYWFGFYLLHYICSRATGLEQTSTLPLSLFLAGAVVGAKQGVYGMLKFGGGFSSLGLAMALFLNAERDGRGINYIILTHPVYKAAHEKVESIRNKFSRKSLGI